MEHTPMTFEMKTMIRTYTSILAGLTLATPVFAQDSNSDVATGYISLLDAAPPLYQGVLRYPKFYGDPNTDRATVHGPLMERQYLLGSMGGARDRWADNGFVLDAGVTQVYQGVSSGDGDSGEYYGSGDLYMAVDTGRAKWWSGGLIFAHVEGNWGNTVTGTGALLPLNFDNTMPAAPSEFALSEFYLVQGLPKGWALVAGKVNFSAWADKSFFANNERTEFMYTGLVNNPILGAFVPYTSLGLMALKQINEEVGVGFMYASNNTNALSAGFDDLSSDTMTYGFAATWTPKFNGKPGDYELLVGYTNKDLAAYDLDERHLIGEITGEIPLIEKNGNSALTLTATQYLWVDENARRSDGQTVGIGPFFRFGISPKDRNVIAQFVSLGVGGKGGFLDRVNDSWGVGWASTKISADFRRDVEFLGYAVDSHENAIEGFYNIALTPAIYLSLHAQYVNSADPTKDQALVLGSRLQLDL